MQNTILARFARLLLAALAIVMLVPPALAANRAALERDARNAYQKLIARVPAAKALSQEADAVLVFPKITKAGLVVGGLDLKDLLGAEPSFTIVVTGGFGAVEVAPEILGLLKASEGSLALLDGTTQMRVGVRRPRVILPTV